MAPSEIARTLRLRLASELSDDQKSLDRIAASINTLRGPAADARDEWMRARALAFELERYYTVLESTLHRMVRTLDGEAPSGGGWHQDLLRAASAEIEGGRPALIAPETVAKLVELLKFRHLARHGYETEPKLLRLEELAAIAVDCHTGVDESLGAFKAWLKS